MDRIEKRILVDAPIPSVFRFVNEPFNLLRICPDIIEVASVVGLKNGGGIFSACPKWQIAASNTPMNVSSMS